MTVYALGDYHGKSIKEFIEAESPTSEDTILSTGDFDQVSVIHEFLELKDRIGESSVVDVGANHDHALLERIPIGSGTIHEQDKHLHEMVDELHRDTEAKNYLREIVDNPVREFQVGDLEGVLVHGGLAGHLQSDEISEDMKHFWYRLWSKEDYEANLDRMGEEGYDIMVRGHDHLHHYYSRLKRTWEGGQNYSPPSKGTNERPGVSPEIGAIHQLDEDYRTIINHGPWYEGKYIAIDEEDLEIEFRSI